jgi:DNA-directed RNA polymerase specialized sigma24 family protein
MAVARQTGDMKDSESRAFLKGEMDFTPTRMMRYIRSRARLATDEDIEDILQNALLLVTQHFDCSHPDGNLSLYCLGACNKAIAQNLERYHKVVLKKRDPDAKNKPRILPVGVSSSETEMDGQAMKVTGLAPGKSFDDSPTNVSQWRTTSLDSMFDEDDGRNPEDVLGWELSVLSGDSETSDPAVKALINDLIEQILAELPTQLHRTCFLLKYVEGHKREDLISCLKMDPKSIDTVDKKIVRTLKAFKEKLDRDEARI